MIIAKKEDPNFLAGYEIIANTFQVKKVKDISEQANLIEHHLDTLNEFDRHLQVIAILNKNEEELISKLDYYCRHTSFNILSTPKMSENNQNFIEINRCTLNLLSSLKTFLDCSETFLRRKHGKDASEVKQFKQAQKELFDKNFSYRFCYNLRNYAQHCGLPVGGFDTNTIHSSETNTLTDVTIFVDRDLLIKNFDWREKLKNELLEKEKKINLGSHLCQFVECIRILSNKLLEIEFSSVISSMKYVEEMIQHVSDKYPGAHPVIYKFSTNKFSYGDIYWLPTELISEIKAATNNITKT